MRNRNTMIGSAGRCAATLFGAALLIGATSTLQAQTIAITNGSIYPISGPRIDRGTVLIQNGRITAIGANVAVPAGATVIDAAGKWVTPGFIHASARAGGGVASLFAFSETSKQGEVNPSFNPSAGLDPEAITIPVARTGGIATGVINAGGSFLPGQSVVVDFAGDSPAAMIVRSPAAMGLNLSASSRGAGGGSRAGTLARVKQLFADAREYERRGADYRRGAIQELSAPAAELEALLPVLRGTLPLAVNANRKIDIVNAIALKREYSLRMVLTGGAEAWKVAAELAAERIPVAIDPTTDIPSFDGLGARLDNAALLRAAGVSVVLAGGDPGGERSLRYGAGSAVAHGMSWDDALRAVTLAPAEAFGIADRYGALAVGRAANVVIWSGDPFEFSSRAEKVMIRGVETSLHTRENELRERYRTLPPPR